MAALLDDSDLRLLEAWGQRVMDFDLAHAEITVEEAQGEKTDDPSCPSNHGSVLSDLAKVRSTHQQDLMDGHGRGQLPQALARKDTDAAIEWAG